MDMSNDPLVSRTIHEISHQVKQPLTTINLYSEALLAGHVGALNEQQRDYLREIHTASQKLVQAINKIISSVEASQ
jgi:signal transduction histidine kinase